MDIKNRKNTTELKDEISGIVDLILSDYTNGRDIDQMDVYNQPDRDVVKDIVIKLLRIIYPGYSRDKIYRSYNDNNRIAVVIEDVIYN
ncbi:MAG: serine acetyltransferase, partial [Butyrivibrio sp.]|nr:serine acetyltransferase [Butyrivibrio sp.]